MTFREIEKLLKEAGWKLKSVKGSHYHYIHPYKSGKITLPKHKGDLKLKTTQSILKKLGEE